MSLPATLSRVSWETEIDNLSLRYPHRAWEVLLEAVAFVVVHCRSCLTQAFGGNAAAFGERCPVISLKAYMAAVNYHKQDQ